MALQNATGGPGCARTAGLQPLAGARPLRRRAWHHRASGTRCSRQDIRRHLCCQASHGITNLGQVGKGEDGLWEIWWCYHGWYEIADRLEHMLPPWARLYRMDPTRPLHEQVANARVLIPTTGTVDRAAIVAARDLKLIAQPASGYNNIDVGAARERGVPVTLAPGYNSQAVAEVALCMMLMLSRRIDEARQAFQQGVIGEPVGHQLYGKTLGIVGLGRVGKCLAAAAQGLGMKVMSTTSSSSRADLEELLRSADVVSLHTPLTPHTLGLIGHTELSMMKPGALLINCARGSVIDKHALVQALHSGHLGGAGLDCHWIEPADPLDPLYQHPRVLALPHLGSISQEVYHSFATVLCENIIRAREGRPLLHQLESSVPVAVTATF